MTIALSDKYEQERNKRLEASKGLAQYLDKGQSAEYILRDDPWVEPGTPVQRPVPDNGHVKIVVFGAGFGGILAAIKCLDTGAAASPEDLLIVDPAGGFGGTWYWNRYPGLMCDIESYVYLPLLEETGYIPTRRYAGGEEIRKYSEELARRWRLTDRAMFQSSGKSLKWDSGHWVCEIEEKPKGLEAHTATIKADYAFIASGTFTYPKVPNIPGTPSFKGNMLHTGRWDYNVTGGTAANPVLDKLKDKVVIVVGTGATAIQAVPELAKYSKELYIVQRTPAAVDYRGNRDTDLDEWETKIANKKGWQHDRASNLQIFTEQHHSLPENLVDDGFPTMPSIAATFGGPSDVTPEELPKHMETLRALDDARSDRVRQRAVDVVEDPDTAKKLQAWYPGWCKRPCFHDEYLPAFNQSNVHLIDTDGQGVERVTENGIVANGREYDADIIIWSTGYGNPLTESLAGKAGIAVEGKDSQDMEGLSKNLSLLSLHGCISLGFPNLFLMSLAQAGVGANQIQRLEEQSVHSANIIVEAERRVAKGEKPIVEPTKEACDRWADEMASCAHLTSTILTCTPSYFSLEGDAEQLPPEVLGKMARTGLYGKGFLTYARILADWRAKGDLDGIEIVAAQH